METKVIVIKENGTTEPFNAEKIYKAIRKSASRVLIDLTDEDCEKVANKVLEHILSKTEITVTKLHTLVETALDETGFDKVAKSYKEDRSNANYDDSLLVSTKRSILFGEQQKERFKRLLVIKRNGTKEPFNIEKIIKALEATFNSCGKKLPPQVREELEEYLSKNLELQQDEDIEVDTIHSIVEQFLMKYDYFDESTAYIQERYRKTLRRAEDERLVKGISEKLGALNVQNQNANVDEHSFGGRIGEASRYVTKDFALNYCMSRKAKNNHLNNEIYIHDLDSYAVGCHNCLTIPFDDLLAKGFNTRQVDIRPANSINTAFQLIAVIFQIQSLEQFGGVSASHLDWTMVPYVRKSFYKHFKEGLEFILDFTEEQIKSFGLNDEMSIEDEKYKSEPKVYNYSLKLTTKELNQAAEGLYHNLNSLQSRSGNQLPFTSINYGTCTLIEGRMVIKALLEGSINGVGKLHKTPIFPCGIFQYMKGVNDKPGTPNYDLYRLALESTTKRLYPNYANVDWSGNAGYDRNDPRTYFSTMGK